MKHLGRHAVISNSFKVQEMAPGGGVRRAVFQVTKRLNQVEHLRCLKIINKHEGWRRKEER